MKRPLSVVLGDRQAVTVPHTPLYSAIDAHLHGSGGGATLARGRGLALGAALGLALLPAVPAQAAMLTVDSLDASLVVDTFCTLPEAVGNANDNAASHVDCVAGEAGLDSIVFDPALAGSTITLSGELVVEDELEINGAAALGLSVSAGNVDRALSALAPLTVANLTLEDGDKLYGGAIRASAPLAVDNVLFFYNESDYAGGAIYASGGLTVTNSRFIRNASGGEDYGHGGAIAATGSVTVTGSNFYANAVYGYGGAIAVSNRARLPVLASKGQEEDPPASLTVTDSRFVYNLAIATKYHASAGGAVALLPRDTGLTLAHSLDVDGSSFTYNAATPYVGGPPQVGALRDAAKDLAKGSGKYGSSGGAVAVFMSNPFDSGKGVGTPDTVSAAIGDSSFAVNSAVVGGGAILSASTVTVAGSAFDGNTAIIGGGAVIGSKYLAPLGAPEGTISLEQTRFEANSAAGAGGLVAGGATIAVSDVSVIGNIAGSPSSQAAARAKGQIGKYLPPFQCSGGKYVGGMALYGTEVTVTGATSVTGNCADALAGGSIAVATDGTGLVDAGVLFDGNSALYEAGGIALHADDGAELVFQGTVTGNSAGFLGGGVLASANGTGSVVISGATISGNAGTESASAGGGLLVDSNGGNITVRESTISGNSAGASGGGVMVLGSPPPPPSPASSAKGGAATAVLFENSTVHGNQLTGSPGDGGGIAFASYAAGSLSFVTVTGNSASGSGGGLSVGGNADVTLRNSIIAGNTASSAPDLSGTVNADFVLVQDATGATLTGANNQTGLDPLLGPLQDNGGPTLTRLPLAASPARNSGDPAFAPPPATDQRGAGFPRVVNGVVDKGAVEAPPPAVLSLAIDPASVAEGASATLTATLDGVTGADALLTVAFTGAASFATDFTVADADGGVPGVQLLVPTGSSTGTATLTAVDDALDEADEGFTAAVTSAVEATLAGSVEASGTILDNDAAPTVTLTLSQDTILEEGGSTLITATLSAPSGQDVVVTLGFSGSATAGSDYTAGTQIVIPAGQLSASITLTALDDAADEDDETVVVDILAVTNGLESGAQQGTVTITGGGLGTGTAPPPVPQPAIIPTLSEWMLMLLGLLLPATVAGRLRRRTQEVPRRR